MMILESCLSLPKRGNFSIRRQLAEFELNQNDIRKVSFLGNGLYFRIFWVLIVNHAWLDHSNARSLTMYENGVWIELQLVFANFHRCHFQIFCDALHLPRLANSHPAEIWPFEWQITVSPASYCFLSCPKFPHSNSHAIAPLRGLQSFCVCHH